jgi:hypothetical protein
MAGLLLGAFPFLLLFNPRLAWVALVVAVVLLVNKRFTAARANARRGRFEHEVNP